MSVFRKILRTYKMDDPILEQLIKLKWDPKNDGKARTFNYLQSEYKLAHSVTIFLYSFLSFNYVCKPSSCFNPFVNPSYKYHPRFVVWRILDNPEFMISSSRFYKVICFRCVLNKCIGYFLENYNQMWRVPSSSAPVPLVPKGTRCTGTRTRIRKKQINPFVPNAPFL